MLRKILDCENSQENVSNGVYFSETASLQCTDCISTIKRLHNSFFSEDVVKY